MMNLNFDAISDALRDARTVGVASHLRPDADALGSTIAFALWLRDCGKEVVAYNEEGSTSKFHYLPCHEIISLPPTAPQKFDAFVALDTSVKNRLGTVLEAIAPGTPILNIDHHISNESFGDVNYIDPSAPATGQILLEFFQRVGARISPEMATNLFAAISTDTGSFQYAGTNERTFAAAIDFYFACTDALAYDIAATLNAWCFEAEGSFNVTKAQALIGGYEERRPMSAAEKAALPLLAHGAAMRFFLTRLQDWANPAKDALITPKDPLEYERKLAVHRAGVSLFGFS